MSKPRVGPSFGISLGDVLILPERHPACRRREARLGSCTERENLHGDAKGKGTSVADRKAESTDAPVSGGLLGSSDEASVMLVERRALPLRRSACRDADFAHFHYASGITILRRRNRQIFGP